MDAIKFLTDHVPASDRLSAFYRRVHGSQAEIPEALHTAVAQSGWVATAWQGDRLVGLARVLTDGVFVAYLQELLVDPDYQHQGVAKALLDLYDGAFGDFHNQVAIIEPDWVKSKLGKRGFKAEPAALSRVRPLSTWSSP